MDLGAEVVVEYMKGQMLEPSQDMLLGSGVTREVASRGD